ncbi:MAG: exo-alpha-sialidase [Williamsia sp.]|nr:exo-alpha-sialidase [Williamsia sp.]
MIQPLKWATILTFLFMAVAVNAQSLNHLYRAGDDGYSCFRIPALITTVKGTILAFAEARKNGCGDAGDIDLVVKRSEDGGKTWGPLQLVWSDSTNTCGNPAPVVDSKTGRIILLSTWNLGSDHEKDIIAGTSQRTRRVFLLLSADDGRSWSSPKEITPGVKPADWTWYATGPGRGVQISRGKYKGRFVVPANHVVAGTKQNFSHAIYSDGGDTWKLGGNSPIDSTNESTLAELSDGRLMLNMRNASTKRVRQTAISKDGGQSWLPVQTDTTLIEPVCEANMIRYEYRGKKEALLFSNPANKTARSRMTIRVSYDNGKTWPAAKLLYEGPSAYSCLTVLPNGHIGCFYEAGLQKPYEGIVWEEVGLEDLEPVK